MSLPFKEVVLRWFCCSRLATSTFEDRTKPWWLADRLTLGYVADASAVSFSSGGGVCGKQRKIRSAETRFTLFQGD